LRLAALAALAAVKAVAAFEAVIRTQCFQQNKQESLRQRLFLIGRRLVINREPQGGILN